MSVPNYHGQSNLKKSQFIPYPNYLNLKNSLFPTSQILMNNNTNTNNSPKNIIKPYQFPYYSKLHKYNKSSRSISPSVKYLKTYNKFIPYNIINKSQYIPSKSLDKNTNMNFSQINNSYYNNNINNISSIPKKKYIKNINNINNIKIISLDNKINNKNKRINTYKINIPKTSNIIDINNLNNIYIISIQIRKI